MLIARLVALATLLATGGSLIAWILTGNPRYRRSAWLLARIGIAVLLLILGLFVLERLAA